MFILNCKRSAVSGASGLVIRSWMTVFEDLQIETPLGSGIQLTDISKGGGPADEYAGDLLPQTLPVEAGVLS